MPSRAASGSSSSPPSSSSKGRRACLRGSSRWCEGDPPTGRVDAVWQIVSTTLANRQSPLWEVIDEVQRAPELILPIKARVDADNRAGQYLLSILADRSSRPLSIEGIARGLAISKNTVERYIALFEEVFLVKRIPAWTNSATTRATRQRKLVFVDSGVCAHLAGLSPERLQRDPARAGSLVESFVISEIMRQLAWSDSFARLHHYRTRDGEEVDAVIEHYDGRIVGIEVKASSSVTGDDVRHLRHLRSKAGAAFHLGVLLYTGTEVLGMGDQLIAAPIDSLWRSG